jgi:hypothetical protein
MMSYVSSQERRAVAERKRRFLCVPFLVAFDNRDVGRKKEIEDFQYKYHVRGWQAEFAEKIRLKQFFSCECLRPTRFICQTRIFRAFFPSNASCKAN